MDSWVLWVVIACVFGFGELHTNGLFLAPFALGALLAALLSVAGAGSLVVTVAFFASALGVLLVLRPLAVKHRRSTPAIRTGTAALVGKPAVVLERIANHEGMGSVKIGGEVWTARAYDEDDVIETGQRVEVVEIKGATALVMR
jgi:membrane protein implicated in regulation of membrane protease activity